MRLLLFVLTLLFAVPVAYAQTEACAPYDHAQFKADMDAADKKLSDFDLSGARRQLSDTQKKLPCLDTIVKPSFLARYGRQVSLVFFFDQDEDSTRRWGLMSRYAMNDLPWPSDFPPDHPFREQLEFAEDPPMGGPTDKGILHPAKGGVFMNGRFLTEAKAHAEVPGLMQVADKKGTILAGFWQDGAAFADSVLGPPGASAEPPKWFVPEDSSQSTAVASAEGTLFEGFEPATKPAPVPAPVKPAPVVPKPEPVAVAPVPAPVVPKPEPVVPKPEPVTVAPVPVVKPVIDPIVVPVVEPVAPKPKPEPVAVAPKPKPEPVAVAPKPEPAPVPAPIKPEPAPRPDPIVFPEPRPPGGGGIATGRLIAGGGLAVAAGGMYAMGAVTRASFFKSETGDQLAARRTTTNILVIASGVTAAAAIGVGVTAFVSDDGGMITFGGRFR